MGNKATRREQGNEEIEEDNSELGIGVAWEGICNQFGFINIALLKNKNKIYTKSFDKKKSRNTFAFWKLCLVKVKKSFRTIIHIANK
jgi:hypothetical protein